MDIHAFFCFFMLFSAQPQSRLNFSWLEFQMLLRCCLNTYGHHYFETISYLVYLCPCLGPGLFMSYQPWFSANFSFALLIKEACNFLAPLIIFPVYVIFNSNNANSSRHWNISINVTIHYLLKSFSWGFINIT